jgi:hypothetical protein
MGGKGEAQPLCEETRFVVEWLVAHSRTDDAKNVRALHWGR